MKLIYYIQIFILIFNKIYFNKIYNTIESKVKIWIYKKIEE